MSSIVDILLTLIKQLIFEEVPENETPKETLQRKITYARNNITAGKWAFLLFGGLSVLLILIVIGQIIFASDANNTFFLLLLSAMFFIAGFLLNRAAEDTRSRLGDLELAYDIEQFEINKEVSYAEKTLRLHNIQLEKYYNYNRLFFMTIIKTLFYSPIFDIAINSQIRFSSLLLLFFFSD